MGLGQLFVRLADLAEAEGRLARVAVFRLCVGMALVALVLVLTLCGAGLLVAAGVMAAAPALGLPLALLVHALALGIIAWAVGTWARNYIKQKIS